MYTEVDRQSDREYIVKLWADDGRKVLEAIDKQDAQAMTSDEFLLHCTACGGNWGGMLLSGIKALYPEVYEVIPESMGKYTWQGICTIVCLLNIDFGFVDEEE